MYQFLEEITEILPPPPFFLFVCLLDVFDSVLYLDSIRHRVPIMVVSVNAKLLLCNSLIRMNWYVVVALLEKEPYVRFMARRSCRGSAGLLQLFPLPLPFSRSFLSLPCRG